jgi:hypothetical protein
MMRRALLTRAVMRAGLAGVLATAGVFVEEGRALAGTPAPAGTGTTIAVALAAPILVIFSAAFPTRTAMRVHHALRLFLGLACAGAAAVANQTLYPRLYPTLHLGLAVAALFACTLAADGLLEAFADAEPIRVGCVLGLSVLSVFSLGAAPAARALTRSPITTRALHENSELLRPVVRLAAIYHKPPKEAAPPAEDPLARPVVAPAPIAPGWSVLLITIDALRADHVGAYGYSRATTPNIDALAREGAVFKNAYTSAPQTPYALASIMTGTHFRAVRASPPTWAEQFGKHGYATAAFYPEPVFFTDRPRFAALEARHLGFDVATVDYATADARAFQVSTFVNELPRDRPFFAWAHLFEPHEPYEAHDEYPFGTDDVDRYDAEIAATDRGIGVLVRLVRARRPQTLVIVTADHGEAFGEHASRYHGTTLYEEQVHVPLLINGPGLLAAEEIGRPVQTIDLFPTVARIVDAPILGPLRGRDLFALGEGVAFSSLVDVSLLAIGDERFMCQTAIATCTLYDLSKDPLQESPLVTGPRVDVLRASLEAAHAGNAAASR